MIDNNFEMGMKYYNGDELPINFNEAWKAFNISAKDNNPEAFYMMGVMYDNGYHYDGPPKQKSLFSRIMDRLNDNKHSGIHYEDLEDEEKAKVYYEKAAMRGHAKAMYKLAENFRMSNDFKGRDSIVSYRWYALAKAFGYSDKSRKLEQMTYIILQSEVVEAQAEALKYYEQIKENMKKVDKNKK